MIDADGSSKEGQEIRLSAREADIIVDFRDVPSSMLPGTGPELEQHLVHSQTELDSLDGEVTHTQLAEALTELNEHCWEHGKPMPGIVNPSSTTDAGAWGTIGHEVMVSKDNQPYLFVRTYHDGRLTVVNARDGSRFDTDQVLFPPMRTYGFYGKSSGPQEIARTLELANTVAEDDPVREAAAELAADLHDPRTVTLRTADQVHRFQALCGFYTSLRHEVNLVIAPRTIQDLSELMTDFGKELQVSFEDLTN